MDLVTQTTSIAALSWPVMKKGRALDPSSARCYPQQRPLEDRLLINPESALLPQVLRLIANAELGNVHTGVSGWIKPLQRRAHRRG